MLNVGFGLYVVQGHIGLVKCSLLIAWAIFQQASNSIHLQNTLFQKKNDPSCHRYLLSRQHGLLLCSQNQINYSSLKFLTMYLLSAVLGLALGPFGFVWSDYFMEKEIL